MYILIISYPLVSELCMFTKSDWEREIIIKPLKSPLTLKDYADYKTSILERFVQITKVGSYERAQTTRSEYVNNLPGGFKIRMSDHMVGLKASETTLSMSVKDPKKINLYKLNRMIHIYG